MTGDLVWSHDRPKIPNYTSPVIVNAAGREQLVFTGCNLVSSFEPLTGKTLWEVAGATEECVTSTVTDGEVIFTSGGYPKNHLAAVRADGSGKIVWEKGVRVYVPSMLHPRWLSVRPWGTKGLRIAGRLTAGRKCGVNVWGRERPSLPSPVMAGEKHIRHK